MTAAIEITGLKKRFGSLQALSGIDLTIERGEFFGLLGPNGAGKSTLINLLAGLLRPDHGFLRILGHDVVRQYRSARLSLGVVPQEIVYDPFFTVRETLLIQSGYYGLRRNHHWINTLLERLDLTDKADVNMRALSGGMKRRVLVAQALVHRPEVIVLDEPTAGVDVELRQTLWAFIQSLNSQGHTIVLTTHYLEEAQEFCQRIAMLKQGQIVALDTTKSLLASFEHRELKVTLNPFELPDALRPMLRQSIGATHILDLPSLAGLEETLAIIRQSGAQIEDLSLSEPDLEDIFVSIMNEQVLE
ncbi:MAG TPA: ABC transporter ATP-binding protein [Burkholderiales bacterium]|nr:ABC transporter ATP-binding protein [Burkholderiales bacterium]